MAFGMEPSHKKPFGEATREEFGKEENRGRQFKAADLVDNPSYLTSAGGVVTMNLYHYQSPDFRFLPFIRGNNGNIELLGEVNQIVNENNEVELNAFDFVDLFLEDRHKQPHYGCHVFYCHHDRWSCALVDRAAVTFLTQEKDCMPLCNALSGLKYQLEKMRFVKNIIPVRKNLLYTNPDEPNVSDAFAYELSFSADTHENREKPALRIGKVYPFNECIERLRLNLKNVGSLMMSLKETVQKLHPQDSEPEKTAE